MTTSKQVCLNMIVNSQMAKIKGCRAVADHCNRSSERSA
jgi:hypothetical protein